jgi:hypothetical protein
VKLGNYLGVVTRREPAEYPREAPATFEVTIFSDTGEIGNVRLQTGQEEGSHGTRYKNAPPVGQNVTITFTADED